MKSFAWLACRVVGLLLPVKNKSTTQQTSYSNDFVNSKSQYEREKPLLTGYKQGTVITCTSVRYTVFIQYIALKTHFSEGGCYGVKTRLPINRVQRESFLKLDIRES